MTNQCRDHSTEARDLEDISLISQYQQNRLRLGEGSIEGARRKKDNDTHYRGVYETREEGKI